MLELFLQCFPSLNAKVLMSCCVFACLKSFAASLLMLGLLSFVYKVVVPLFRVGSPGDLAIKLNKSGKAWAVVTGTTSGIGLAFCHAFAKLGFNVLMVSRNESKLREIKAEILKTCQTKVKVEFLCVDLSGREEKFEELEKFVSANEVAVLVNNAGLNTDFPKLFVDNSRVELESMIAVNCRSVAVLTHTVLPSMIHRRLGCVINVSSLFGQLAGPLVSVYSGSKGFIDSFSLSLTGELAGTGVTLFNSLPGFVVSNMSKIKRTSFTVISADACVQAVLGQVAGGSLTVASPHWTHSAIGWFLTVVLPEGMRLALLTRINRKTNRAALKKLEKNK